MINRKPIYKLTFNILRNLRNKNSITEALIQYWTVRACKLEECEEECEKCINIEILGTEIVQQVCDNLTIGVIDEEENPLNVVESTLLNNNLILKVEVPPSTHDLDLVDRYGNTFPTRQVSNNATWDLRTLTPFDYADIFLSRESSWGGSTIENALIDCVDSLIASGLWSKLLSWHPRIGGTASSCKWNAIYPFNTNNAFIETFTGGTFSAKGAFFALNQFGFTTIAPLITGSHLNISMGVFLTTEFTNNAATQDRGLFNCSLTNNRQLRILLRSSDGRVTWCGNGNGNNTFTPSPVPSTYIGKHYAVSRINNTDERLYIDGTLAQTITRGGLGETSGVLHNQAMVLAWNQLSANPLDGTLGSGHIGYGLNGTEMGDLHTILNTFEATVR